MPRVGLRRTLATAVTAVLALVALGVGSAARLDLVAGSIATADVGHPCPGTATAAAPAGSTSAATVEITLPGACAGRTVSVVVRSGTTVVTAGSATAAASGATTVPVGTYSPSGSLTAASAVDGWAVPATWAYTPPAPATCRLTGDVLGWGNVNGRWGPIIGPPSAPSACAVTGVVAGSSWTSGGRTYQQLEVTVRNTSTVEAVWRATLGFGQSPFPAWIPQGFIGLGNGAGSAGWNAHAAEGCGQLPLLDVVGNVGSTEVIAAGKSRTFGFQIVSGPAGDLVCP